ncbi:MAG: 30S ribosome-binding factor RbfA [Rhabdaerophilum sp.]
MHPSQPLKGPSQRQLRVGEQVRHALSDALSRGDVHDAALDGFIISVLEVRMSPDLRHATVLIMPLGGKGEAEAVAALNRNAKPLRGEVSRRLRGLKFAPDIRFRVDDRYDEAARIEKIFAEERVKRDLANQTNDEPDPT